MNEWQDYAYERTEGTETERGRGRRKAAWLDDSGTGPSGIFRGSVSYILRPYAEILKPEGYNFSADRFAERFELTDEQREIVRKAIPNYQLGGQKDGHNENVGRKNVGTGVSERVQNIRPDNQGQSENDIRGMGTEEGRGHGISLTHHKEFHEVFSQIHPTLKYNQFVELKEDYTDYRTFLSEDKKSGFALKKRGTRQLCGSRQPHITSYSLGGLLSCISSLNCLVLISPIIQ
jgi:hypothetical protein